MTKKGDDLEIDVTKAEAIPLRSANIAGREPTPEQEAEILAAVDEARDFHARKRRR